ncbi:MAG TPA: cupin domain-containing protein [Gaiellales bacterium]|nr:cupin domain-containing protein [Gaiellales bacterium]
MSPPRSLNVRRCELAESLDRPGFHHRAAPIGQAIGAARIGAAVYEAEADRPIWPYHYHHAFEEWLYVIAGSPVLRDGGGERALDGGDLVSFPAGRCGAHTIRGPGRFIVFSTEAPGPYIAVYPDSDKVAVATGEAGALILPRAAVVDYWHGEDDGPSEPVEAVREPATPSPPLVNARTVPLGGRSTVDLTSDLAAEQLRAAVRELPPGEDSGEYHYAHGREEWALVLAGAPTLRHPDGEDVLEVDDVVCFPDGPAGAHRLSNPGDQIARVLCLATTGRPVNVCYPDSGRWSIRNGPDADELVLVPR